MDDYLRYIEDKHLVRWIFHPTPENEAYWEKYLQDPPSEHQAIHLSRTILSQLKSKKADKEDPEIYELYATIIQQIDRQKKFKKTGLTVAKYAAAALVFLSLSIIWNNLKNKPASELTEQFMQQTIPAGNETQLILPDGKNIVIAEKESDVEMQTGGNIIINKKDTISGKTLLADAGPIRLIVPFGKNSSVRLPDGTIAWLNAGSSLIYPARFEGKRREVSLIGEGYFEVAHNTEMPFIVITTDLRIKALGTSFNVSAYPADQITEVVLAEGKVGLTETAFSLQNKQHILVPDQLAVFDRENGHTTIKNVNVENYISWHKGYLNMESIALNRIVAKLERYYHIEIDFQDPLLGLKIISGKIVLKEEKDKILTVLASTASLELIKINEQKYVLK